MPMSREYLEEALAQAKKLLPGWQYALLHSAAFPKAGGKVSARVQAEARAASNDLAAKEDEEDEQLGSELVQAIVQSIGPVNARVAFFGASPSRIEAARREPFVGPVADTLRKVYLEPMGLRRCDAVLSNVVPVSLTNARGQHRDPNVTEIAEWAAWVRKEIKRLQPVCIVALGQIAKAALGSLAQVSLPHPAAVMLHGDTGEVGRKLARVMKELEKRAVCDPLPGSVDTDKEIPIAKADDEKQIVYGVVLDPYQVDAHNDWTPPSEIENTAHEYMRKSRVVGIQHGVQADAHVVESWLVPYPSEEDYKAAMKADPHKAYQMPYGKDIVHSGAWVLGTKLGDGPWAEYKAGKLNAYSIGGFGKKTAIKPSVMPAVEFVDFGPDTKQNSAT
jgi:uracil-DNA glycosylase family 4